MIDTPHGVLLHTGDWKLDPEPLIGPPTDEAAFAALGERGVLAMICDSTNAMVEGHSGSEAEVRQSLTALMRGLRGRVAVTCFASNVARMESVALAAHAAGRSVALVGRSLRNIDAAARECGYLRDLPPFLTEDDVDDVPDDNLLMLVTGSQGEPRSALARIAMDTHPRVALGEGDTVVFSSRMIPGNERAIGTVQDNLVRRGVTSDDRRRSPGARLRPSGARRTAAAVPPGEAALRGADAWRVAASVGACRAGAGGGCQADPAGGRRHPEPRARTRRRWWTARRSAGWCWTATA